MSFSLQESVINTAKTAHLRQFKPHSMFDLDKMLVRVTKFARTIVSKILSNVSQLNRTDQNTMLTTAEI